MTIGTLSLLLAYIDMLLSPIDWVVGLSENMASWTPKIRKMLDLIAIDSKFSNYAGEEFDKNVKEESKKNKIGKNEDTQKVGKEVKTISLNSSIDFVNVTFCYVPTSVALNDISFSILRGKTTALVGRSGAGKSTITQLLLRLYEPTSGKILWDGKDSSKISKMATRKTIAFVPQDPELFNRTISENISYGKPGASTAEILKAAHDAFAHDFITKTSDGYDSLIGEKGIKLSGGQRQRIAIARALILNPSLLILDESTSQLDSESEKAIQTYITASHPNRAQLIIAHRLSTVRKADNIIVLNEGSIIGQGKYEELLKTCELFKKFHDIQANSLTDKTL